MKKQPDLLQDYSTLIECIYESVLDSQRWQSVAKSIQEMAGADVCHIQFRTCLELDHAPISFLSNVDPSYLESYKDYYFQKDVWVEGMHKKMPGKVGGVYNGNQLVPEKEFVCSEFYNDFLKPQDHHNFMATVRQNPNSGELAAIGLINAKRRPFEGESFERTATALQILIPHLWSAYRISSRLYKSEEEAGGVVSTLDKLNIPVLLVDQDMRMSYMNAAASNRANGSKIFDVKEGYLCFHDARISSGVKAAIHRVFCGADKENSAPLHIKVALPGEKFLEIAVSGISNHLKQMGRMTKKQLACLFLFDSDGGDADLSKMLCALYDLSPAEARFAQTWARYCDLSTAADVLYISLNTAKTHLKRIFEKTGCRKQSELIKLLYLNSAQWLRDDK